MPLPYNPAVPLYYQVAQVLRARLEGDDHRGSRLPTEHSLCQEFGVSRTTVRQALALLKQHGLLNSRRGTGTFVSAGGSPVRLAQPSGDPLHQGLATKVRVVLIEHRLPPLRVAEFLNIPKGTPILRLIRVHSLDGSPISVVVSYLPGDLAPVITKANLRSATLHEILWKKAGLRLERSIHTIRVGRADEMVAPLLALPLAEPVLYIRSQAYLEGGKPIRLTDNYFNETRYEYVAEMRWHIPE